MNNFEDTKFNDLTEEQLNEMTEAQIVNKRLILVTKVHFPPVTQLYLRRHGVHSLNVQLYVKTLA